MKTHAPSSRRVAALTRYSFLIDLPEPKKSIVAQAVIYGERLRPRLDIAELNAMTRVRLLSLHRSTTLIRIPGVVMLIPRPVRSPERYTGRWDWATERRKRPTAEIVIPITIVNFFSSFDICP